MFYLIFFLYFNILHNFLTFTLIMLYNFSDSITITSYHSFPYYIISSCYSIFLNVHKTYVVVIIVCKYC